MCVISIVKPESLSEMNPQAKVPVFVDAKVRAMDSATIPIHTDNIIYLHFVYFVTAFDVTIFHVTIKGSSNPRASRHVGQVPRRASA